MRRNSWGRTPSRVMKPLTPRDTPLRGLPSSQTRTFLRQRPRMRAAFRPAGPAPTIMASYIEDPFRTESFPSGGLFHFLAQHFETQPFVLGRGAFGLGL